jgi:serine protease
MSSRILPILTFANIALAVGLAIPSAAPAQGAPPTGEGTWSSEEEVRDLLEGRLDEVAIIPGKVIVKLVEGAEPGAAIPMSDASRLRTTSGGEYVLDLSGDGLVALSDRDEIDSTLEVVEQLRQHPDVEYVQPSYRYQITAEPNDTLYRRQWGYFDPPVPNPGALDGGIGLPAVWEATQGRTSVVVAVIDTGIVAGHPDITGSSNLLPGVDLIRDSRLAGDQDGRDQDATDVGDAVRLGECGVDRMGRPIPRQDLKDSWHGSHVAGTVGVGFSNNELGIAGVNWSVKVLPIRVLGKCGGATEDVADAIRWAVGVPVAGVEDNPPENRAQVINLSLGSRGPCSDSPVMRRAIEDAIAAGATVVVAAGNEGQDASGFTPASCPGVITVAAADRRGHLASRYSNFGITVDLLAPGGDVGRDDDSDGWPDGILSYVRDGYDLYNGTSMAAPHVAGVAAMLLTAQPGLTPAQVEAELKRQARPVADTGCPPGADRCGAGLLDARFLAPVTTASAGGSNGNPGAEGDR